MYYNNLIKIVTNERNVFGRVIDSVGWSGLRDLRKQTKLVTIPEQKKKNGIRYWQRKWKGREGRRDFMNHLLDSNNMIELLP